MRASFPELCPGRSRGTARQGGSGSQIQISPLLSAIMASLVMASHSSRMMSLNLLLQSADQDQDPEQAQQSDPRFADKFDNRMLRPASQDKGQGRAGSRARSPEDGLGGGKVLDLLPDHVNASVIRGIELEHHVLSGGAIDLACNGQHCGCLASSRRPVQQEVRQAVLLGKALDCRWHQQACMGCAPVGAHAET
jgi:hypothetical protein